MRIRLFFIALLPLTLTSLFAQQAKFPFQNPDLSLDQRIDDLIGRLTLEEKAQMMLYNSPAIERLGIPAYNWWNECLHGVGRAGKATVFPQAIGMAATFDENLIFQVATAISDEARAKHYAALRKGNRQQYTGLTFWTPNINIFRDPRWGRGQETYGEDPLLTGRLGSAFVHGLQGNDPKYLKASACAKHYVVHSGPEKTRHEFNAIPAEIDFRETYLPAFKALVDAGVESVMCAYNRTYDKPCCGSDYLLTEILRQEWGFQGHIVSDCWALDDIWQRHKVTEDKVQAAAMAANAGVNLNCGYLYKYLPEAVEKGYLKEKTIDEDLKVLLRTRFRLGLLDPVDRTPWAGLSEDIVNNKAHRDLAYVVASKSVVLLKNENALPLDKGKTHNILVTGPVATDFGVLVGNYNGYSGNMVTLFEGIVDRAGPGTIVNYAEGYPLDGQARIHDGMWMTNNADAVIACVGITPLFEGEEGDALLNPNGGDRKKIELPANQIEYIRRLKKKLKNDQKLIVVVTGGSAIALGEVTDLADAILFAWYPGEQGGNAVADIIFGNINPSGKLPVTFYQSTDDLPPFEDYSMKNRTYRFFRGRPLYPFGYGLSYTSFAFSDLKIAKNSWKQDDVISLTLKVSNTGNKDGEEVVQVYVRKADARPDDPIRSLAGFKRIFIKKGETGIVELEIPVSTFARWNIENQKYETPFGEYMLEIGRSAGNILLKEKLRIE